MEDSIRYDGEYIILDLEAAALYDVFRKGSMGEY